MPSSTDRDTQKTQRNFDRRIVERNIKRGIVTRQQYDQYLKALPDAASNVAVPEPLRPAAAPVRAPAAPPAPVLVADPLPGTPVSPEAIAAVASGVPLRSAPPRPANDPGAFGVQPGYVSADDDSESADDDDDDDDAEPDEDLPSSDG